MAGSKLPRALVGAAIALSIACADQIVAGAAEPEPAQVAAIARLRALASDCEKTGRGAYVAAQRYGAKNADGTTIELTGACAEVLKLWDQVEARPSQPGARGPIDRMIAPILQPPAASAPSSGLRAPPTPVATPTTLSAAEQAQLVEGAKSLLDNWAGSSRELAEARDQLSKVIAVNPRNAQARVLMARYYMASGGEAYGRHDARALELAGEQLSIAYKLDPKSPEMLVAFAIFSNYRNNPGDTHKFLNQAVDVRGDPVIIDIARTKAYILEDKWLEAEASIVRAERNASAGTTRASRLASLYEARSDVLLHFRRVRAGIEAQRMVTVVAPDLAWGHGNYAEIVLLWQADYATAIREAQKAIELMDYPVGRFILGMSQYAKWADTPNRSSPAAKALLRAAQTNAPDVGAVMANVAGHVAAGPSLVKLVQALSNDGVSLSSRDPYNKGCTPLTLAIIRDDMKSLDWLIAHKADINARGIFDRTPVFLAVERDDVALVKRLIRLKADVNIADMSGDTPLLTAADRGHAAIVKMLLEAGANTDAKLGDHDAVSIAMLNGHPDIAQLLRDYQAKKRR